MRDLKPLFFVVASLLINFPAYGHEAYYGAHSLSLLGGGSAGLQAPEAAFLNPALVGLLTSGLQLTYSDGAPQPHAHTTNMGASLVDAEAGNISPGVLSYRRVRRTGMGLAAPASGEVWQGAMGKALSSRFVLGIAASFLKFHGDGLDVPDQWYADVGTLFPVTDSLGLAYVWHAIGRPSDRVPTALRENPTQTLGAFFKTEGFMRLRADLSRQERDNPDHKMDFIFSLEAKTSDFFIFRLAHSWEGLEGQNRLGAGLSFEGPRLKLDYGFQKSLADSETMHGVDLRIPF